MHKIWVVARHEYLFHLRRRGFLISTFLMPLILMFLFVLVIVVLFRVSTVNALGYVDQTMLSHEISPDFIFEDAGSNIRMVRYPTLEAAQNGLRDQTVDAVFVIPSDYVERGKVTAYALEGVPSLAMINFERFLDALVAQQLIAEPSPRVLEPIVEQKNVILDAAPTEQQHHSFLSTVLPILFGVILLSSTFAGGSYLMLALLEEKEQRIMEILVSSISPYQLMAGKIIGLGALALTQLFIWTSGGVCLLLWGATKMGLIGTTGIAPSVILLMFMVFFPAYFLIAATLSAIGAAVQSPQQGQQLTGVVTLLSTLPLWFLTVIQDKPNGVVATILNIIPYSAPITIMQRTIGSAVPAWQQIATVVWLWIAAAGVMLLAGKIVRLGLLRYNARVRLMEIWHALTRR